MNRNGERRMIAQRLRDLVTEYRNDPDGIFVQELLCVLEIGVGSSEDFGRVRDVYHLADLIDAETCSNVDDSRHLSTFEPWFECSSCHCKARLGYIAMPLRYCPSCGSEVIDDD
nr:MAG TPA: DNA-directed RNA polymerase [Caudoviricetes sp.]